MAHPDPLSGFRIDAARPLFAELDRISGDELEHIRKQLAGADADPEKAVHQCRKSIKRLRAITLLGRSLDREKSRRLDEDLRNAGHALANARDAGVIDALTRDLAREDLIDGSTRQIVVRAARTGDVNAAVKDCRLALEDAGPLLRSLFAPNSGFLLRDIEAGVGQGYGRSRKSLGRFRKSRSQEDAHRFRRRLQRHLAQMRLIEPLTRLPLAPRIASLDKLSELLGRHHDLALLHQLLEESTFDLEESSRRRLLTTMKVRQKRIDTRAFKAGQRLFGATANEFVRTVFGSDSSGAMPGESAHGA